MAHHSLALIFSLTTLIACMSATTPDLVIEVFRHGARGPISQAFDPNKTYWGGNGGQLTPMGMRMHYILGATIRDQYPELLTSYDPDTIYIRSTDVDRTIMSAYSHMYGVFGNSGPNLLSTNNASAAIPPYVSPDVNELVANLSTTSAALPDSYQPVPVDVVQTADDFILAAFTACPMTRNWTAATASDSQTLSVFQNEMKDIVTYLKAQGLAINSFWDLALAGDNAIANEVQGIPLPGNIDPVTQEQYYKDLKFAFEWYTTQMVEGTPNQVKVYAIDLLGFISGSMNATLNRTSSLNFIFLSAHDLTLLNLLSAFDIVTGDCLLANYNNDKNGLPIEYDNCLYPSFASDVIFEFYNTDEPYVLFYYNGIQVPFCGNTNNNCTFKQFQSYITQVTGGLTSQDFLTMCNIPQNTNTTIVIDYSMTSTYKTVMIILAVVAFVLLISLLLLIFKLHNKNNVLRKQSQLLLDQSFQGSPPKP